MKFNFTGLHSIFNEAAQRNDPSILFSLQNGNGRFVFIIFLSSDSKGKVKWNDVELFVILSRTQKVLSWPLYGNHLKKGDFTIYLKSTDEYVFREELGIASATSGPYFTFESFLQKLNSQIPITIALDAKVALMQRNWPMINQHCAKYVDDARKVYLLSVRRVTNGKPREETLRKLSMLPGIEAHTVARLICRLKEINWTVCWTDKKPDEEKFTEIWAKVFTH